MFLSSPPLNAAWRKDVVPKVPTSTDAQREARASLRLVKRDGKRGRDKLPDDAPLGWAELLKRVFGVDRWECPDCGKRMRLRTVVEGSPAAMTGGFTRGRRRGRPADHRATRTFSLRSSHFWRVSPLRRRPERV